MRIADIVEDSIVDGPGLRLTVFTQGCPHHCPGCHNPNTHDPAGGRDITPQAIIDGWGEKPLIRGLTLSGGEPFLQGEDCAALAAAAHRRGWDVWTYTGYRYEHLAAGEDPGWQALLAETDVLVDGPFVEGEKSYDLRFRGSRNQRLIDLAATRRTGRVTLWEKADPLAGFTVPES